MKIDKDALIKHIKNWKIYGEGNKQAHSREYVDGILKLLSNGELNASQYLRVCQTTQASMVTFIERETESDEFFIELLACVIENGEEYVSAYD